MTLYRTETATDRIQKRLNGTIYGDMNDRIGDIERAIIEIRDGTSSLASEFMDQIDKVALQTNTQFDLVRESIPAHHQKALNEIREYDRKLRDLQTLLQDDLSHHARDNESEMQGMMERIDATRQKALRAVELMEKRVTSLEEKVDKMSIGSFIQSRVQKGMESHEHAFQPDPFSVLNPALFYENASKDEDDETFLVDLRSTDEDRSRKYRQPRPDEDHSIHHIWEHASDFNIETLRAFKEVGDLLMKKRHDYGSQNILKMGEHGVTIRLGDKVERLKHLTDPHNEIYPNFESIEDTWMDVIGYGLLGLLEHRRWRAESNGE